MSDDKPKLEPPKARGVAVLRRPGDPFPEPPTADVVPELHGETIKLNFMADAAIVDVVNEHIERLSRRTVLVTTASDAIRSLLVEGARSYRAKISDQKTSTDDENNDE
jgi:hypothetical protein